VILSLDLGSTSFKAAVIDENLQVHGFCARELRHQFAPGGKVELPVAEATSAARKAIHEAISLAGVRASNFQALAVTSQAQTFTIVDQERGPRIPFISWQDKRAVRTAEKLKKTMPDFSSQCSFGSFSPLLQLCQLRHLKENQPRVMGAKTLMMPLPTFFIYQWSGTFVTDENIAAMTGLYSLVSRTWWPRALKSCGLQAGQLPEVLPVGAVAGRTNSGGLEIGLPRGIPVVLAGNDQTAGAYAARLEESHGLLLTLGTAQAAYTYQERMPRSNPSLIRGPYPRHGHYQMAADDCGGNLINWAKSILAGCETDEKFFSLAAHSPPGCRGLLFEGNNSDVPSASWTNIETCHTPADFARSVLECLTRRMLVIARRLSANLESTPVLLAGSGSQNPLWVEILAKTLGVRVKKTDGRPCVGAARMALWTIQNNRQ